MQQSSSNECKTSDRSSSATISSSNTTSSSQEKRERRKRARHGRSRSNSLTTSVKQQFDELISTFESLIDGQIPLKSQASKLKSKVDDERKKLMSLIKRRQNMVSNKFKSKTLKFRVDVQKSLRTAITGNPNRSIRRHIQEPPQIKFIDKLSFTFSMLILILSELCLVSYPFLFKYFYAAMLCPLMIARWIDYKDKKWNFFMFDFCYFVNFVSISNIFFFPDSTWLFETLFVLANGPVLFAIFVWRNSMVLHSVDKMTSLFIHAFPPFYTYCYRWLDTSRVRIQSTELSMAAWLFYPTIMYGAWQFAYLFKTEVVSKAYLDENIDAETSLRWLARDSKNTMNKIGKKLCIKLGIMSYDEAFDSTTLKTKFIFVTLNFIYFVIMILPVALLFKYKYVHLCVLLFALLCSIWQGANYYIEVFSERYHDSLERKAKELEDKYLFIDENLDSLLLKNWSAIQSDVDTDHDIDSFDHDYDTSDEYTDGADTPTSMINNYEDNENEQSQSQSVDSTERD